MICDDANLRVAARRLANPKFSNCGQMCIAPDYILVPHHLKDELIKELIIAFKNFMERMQKIQNIMVKLLMINNGCVLLLI